jgi:DNA-binding SARP family transcriptional activator
MTVELLHLPQLETLVMQESHHYEALIRRVVELREMREKAQASQPQTEKLAGLSTYSLRVFTLGQETIVRDGKPIAAAEWRATKAKDLFFYLLFNGPTTREQLSLAFWPDTSAQRVRQNFHTTLYRARQALGEEVIILQDGLYLLNTDIEIWCDARELETLAIQARLLSPRDARTEDLWRRAVDFYKGEFLLTLDYDWIITWREASYERYIEALVGYGACVRTRRDYRKALEILQKALALEPFREDIHRAVMLCYAQQGDKQRLEKHMADLRRLLRKELDCEPSGETVDLVRTLLH